MSEETGPLLIGSFTLYGNGTFCIPPKKKKKGLQKKPHFTLRKLRKMHLPKILNLQILLQF